MNPPTNRDAEKSLLSCLLMSPGAWAEAGELEPSDFYNAGYRAVFEAAASLRTQGRPVDPVVVGDELALRGTSKLLAMGDETLADVAGAAPTWHDVKRYASIVTRDATLRRLAAICAEYADKALRGYGDPEDILGEVRRELADLQVRGAVGPVRVGDRLSDVIDVIGAKRTKVGDHMVTTGIPALDTQIGGFRPQQLIVVAARPGIGKTALAGSIAMRAAIKRGVPSLVFSLEMSFQELAERLVGAESDIEVRRLSAGGATDADVKQMMSGCLRGLHEAPLWIDDRVLGIGAITATARAWRLRQRSKQALVVIDYLGLIRSAGKSESRTLEVGRTAWATKMLAKELQCPVVLVSQLNRQSEIDGREPRLSDLRDSGEIEQHADMVLFPHRDGDLTSAGKARILIAKNRGGRVGSVDCWWNAGLMTFEGNEQPQERHPWLTNQ